HISNNTSQNSTDSVLRCDLYVSLFSTVDALFPWMYRLKQICRKKRKEGEAEKGKKEAKKEKDVTISCQISSCFSSVILAIVFLSMYRGISYGWLLVLIPIYLFLQTLIVILKYYNCLPNIVSKVLHMADKYSCKSKKRALCLWSWLMWICHVFFPLYIGILYYNIDHEFLPTLRGHWYYLFIAFFVSLALKYVTFKIAYRFKPKKPFSPVSTDEENPNGNKDTSVVWWKPGLCWCTEDRL
ncbi:uncharacterized protein, partial [Dendropsophus ebraccatus]|uniref:uncharacterized protein n=1 Tax=Dendropsophus ebraccatus TaxID=150705 RepID=UPI0038320272